MSAARDEDASSDKPEDAQAAEPDHTDPATAAAPPKDAGFADSYRPVRLAARDAEDLKVISALLQDAVVTSDEMAYLAAQRRFAMVLNRFRWEEPAARERVRAGVHFDGVLSAKVKGFDPNEKKRPLNLLSIEFTPGDPAPGGAVRIVFSGGAEAALMVDALDAAMADMTRPWAAAATPTHRGG